MNRLDVIQGLTSWLGDETTHPVSVVDAPIPDTGQTLVDMMPYGVIYPLLGWSFETAFTGQDVMTGLPWQITSVGRNYAQAEAFLDLIRSTIGGGSSTPLSVSGVTVNLIEKTSGGGVPTSEPGQQFCSIPERYRIFCS